MRNRNLQYDANEQNIDRMIEVQRQKINHVKMLNTIYKKKSYSLLKQERQIDRQRQMRRNNQLIDKERKWKETQQQINHQNSILRNKLLEIYVPKDKQINQTLKTNESLDNFYKDSKFGLHFGTSPSQKGQPKQSSSKLATHVSITPTNLKRSEFQKQLTETNAKFFYKLSSIKSDLMPRLKLRQHSKDSEYFKEMLMKRHPRKVNRMKKFVQKTSASKHKIVLPISKSFREGSISYDNPQEPFIFY